MTSVAHEDQAGEVFAALADPTRRRIVYELSADGPLTASALAHRVPVSRQAVQKHLVALEEAGLATSARVGREVRYELRTDPFADAEVVSIEESAPAADGSFTRVRVVKAAEFKYPYVRIEETVLRDPAAKAERIAKRTESVADHVIVKLRDGAAERDLHRINLKHDKTIKCKVSSDPLVDIPSFCCV